MSLAEVEALVSHAIRMDFLGDGRGGLSFEDPKDISQLDLSQFKNARVSAVELLFGLEHQSESLQMISLGLNCLDMEGVRQRLGESGGEVKKMKRGWEIETSDSKYVWFGVDQSETCSLSLRMRR
jgi:hypothetical protein